MLKNFFKYLAFFLAVLCVIFFYKKMQGPKVESPEVFEEEVVYETTLPEDFYPFYDRFHTDSIFQLAHIVFPLKGLTKSMDTTKVAEEIFWQKDTWIQHKPFNDQDGTFERTFINLGGIISEQITANDGLFSMEKRYAKLSDEWHLIYYQELLMHG